MTVDGASSRKQPREAGHTTVHVTGRSTRECRSEHDRPETIKDTADLVTGAGGHGIAVAADHLDRSVRAPPPSP